jgi:hypothetical protein
MTTDFSNVRNVWAQKHANRGIIEILRSKLHNDANSWKPADGVDSSLPFPGTFLGSPLSDAELPKLTLHKSPQPNLQAAEADDDNNIIEQGTDGSSSVIEKPKVAIIGAGAAGLFTAMILDHLNNNEQLKEKGFNVSYEIFESAGKNRLGGRLYTYNFESDGSANPAGPHDYYDVGAMRFPENQVMKRYFVLPFVESTRRLTQYQSLRSFCFLENGKERVKRKHREWIPDPLLHVKYQPG